MKRKSICFVVSSPFTAKVFLQNHIVRLSEFYDIFLVANFSGFDQSIFNTFPLNGIQDIAIPRDINLVKDFKALLNLRSYFKEMQFEAIHTITPKAGLVGMIASRMANVETRIHIFTGQVWHTKTGVFKEMLMLFDCLIVWCSTYVLVDGESQRQFLINSNILKESNSFVLGKGSISGVDTSRFVPNNLIKTDVRNNLGITVNEIVFMFLGRMNHDKGIVELATTFNRLQLKYSNIRLLLVGGDEENMSAIIKKTVKNIESVIFYGVTNEPEKMLQACDVFCLPSHREGFGTSIIEASLLEIPVICSDTYGLMETIIENKTGLRHKVTDVDSLYLQMEKLVNNKELREVLGTGGRRYVLENFSAELISEKWLEFYKTKLGV